jgi:hypothetical protein
MGGFPLCFLGKTQKLWGRRFPGMRQVKALHREAMRLEEAYFSLSGTWEPAFMLYGAITPLVVQSITSVRCVYYAYFSPPFGSEAQRLIGPV